MAYTVIRTDNMVGTYEGTKLVSVKVFDAEGKEIAVENGVIVEVGALLDGHREVYSATLATAESKIENCAVIASPEVLYDERKHSLADFINEAGRICRGYMICPKQVFSVTKEGFVGEVVPAVGAEVGIGADGKIDAAGTGLGVCIHIEDAARHTFYAIKN